MNMEVIDKLRTEVVPALEAALREVEELNPKYDDTKTERRSVRDNLTAVLSQVTAAIACPKYLEAAMGKPLDDTSLLWGLASCRAVIQESRSWVRGVKLTNGKKHDRDKQKKAGEETGKKVRDLAAKGYKQKQIARELKCDVSTVSRHLNPKEKRA